jgi:hypothetical protein
MKKFIKFYAYEEIPQLTKDYLLTVADADFIEEIPLEDINSFLQGLAEYDKQKLAEWEDGWVL